MNVYGPRQYYKGAYIAVIMRMLDAIDRGESPTIYGDGSEAFDFVSVEDCARANICAMIADTTDRFYNVGTGVDRSFKEIANIFVDRYSVEIETMHMPEKLINRYQDYTCSDNTKLLSVYDKKFLSLEQGISRYIDYLESV